LYVVVSAHHTHRHTLSLSLCLRIDLTQFASVCAAVAEALLHQLHSNKRFTTHDHDSLSTHIWRHHYQLAASTTQQQVAHSSNQQPTDNTNMEHSAAAYVNLPRGITHATWQQRFWELHLQTCIDVLANASSQEIDYRGIWQTPFGSAAIDSVYYLNGVPCSWIAVPTSYLEVASICATHIRCIRLPAVLLRSAATLVCANSSSSNLNSNLNNSNNSIHDEFWMLMVWMLMVWMMVWMLNIACC
jgi:hypothetical protein